MAKHAVNHLLGERRVALNKRRHVAEMSPEEMQNMSKMMGDMSGMMKQMSERINRGVKKAN